MPEHSPATPDSTPNRGLGALGDVVEPPHPAMTNAAATQTAAGPCLICIILASYSTQSYLLYDASSTRLVRLLHGAELPTVPAFGVGNRCVLRAYGPEQRAGRQDATMAQ
jgi:hypothetical protein